MRIHLAPERLKIKGLHMNKYGSASPVSSMQKAHEPANPEQGGHETAKAIDPIAETFAV
jgi:hypothetical protein